MTRKQKQLLDFIGNYAITHDGVAPSYDEMKAALNLKSKSGVHRLVLALAEAGHIERRPHRARAIELIAVENRPDLHHAFRRLKAELLPHLIKGVNFQNVTQVNQVSAAFVAFEMLISDDGLTQIAQSDPVLQLAAS